MGLLAPYIGSPYQKYIDKYLSSLIPVVGRVIKFYPYLKIGPFPIRALPLKKHIMEICKDPILELKYVAIRDLVLN